MSTIVTNTKTSFDANLNPDYQVATENIGADKYQLIKLIDPTAASTSPIGVIANPLVTKKASPSSLSPASPVTATVGTSSVILVAANASRKGLIITLITAGTIHFGLGTAAVLNSGITITTRGGLWEMDEFTFTTGDIFAIGSAAGLTVGVQEFS